MANPFEEVFGETCLDPNESARRSMRPLRRRFYSDVALRDREDGIAVALDGRPVLTPRRRPLALPNLALAERVAAEWRAQAEFIDPGMMPLTRLANVVIDAVAETTAEVAEDIGKYLRSDLLFYRADKPDRLVARQHELWDPVLAWARDAHGARFVLAEGVVFAEQPDAAVAAMRALLPRDPWRLAAMHVLTTLTGSALLALALAAGVIDADAAWVAAHVDEDWNMELWGRDELALERRARRRAEFDAAVAVLASITTP